MVGWLNSWMDGWVEVERRGIICSYVSGNNGYVFYTLVKFIGVDGGIIYRVVNASPDIKIGMQVTIDIVNRDGGWYGRVCRYA